MDWPGERLLGADVWLCGEGTLCVPRIPRIPVGFIQGRVVGPGGQQSSARLDLRPNPAWVGLPDQGVRPSAVRFLGIRKLRSLWVSPGLRVGLYREGRPPADLGCHGQHPLRRRPTSTPSSSPERRLPGSHPSPGVCTRVHMSVKGGGGPGPLLKTSGCQAPPASASLFRSEEA